jgi:hypothetical protein
MEHLMSDNSQSKHDDQSSRPEGLPAHTALQSKHREWAESWFAGSASCPVCGSDDLTILRTRGEDATRIEEWQCASESCATQWQVELRESAIGIYVDADRMESEWYERVENPPTFQRMVKNDRETATILAALRYWQREGLMSAGHEQDIATANGRLPSLSAEEIDVLCDQIGSSDGGHLRC